MWSNFLTPKDKIYCKFNKVQDEDKQIIQWVQLYIDTYDY